MNPQSKHLFLYGESGAGKSYAINAALDALGVTPRGFRSFKRFEDGHIKLYLSDARDRALTGPMALAAEFFTMPPTVYTEAFDGFGADTLEGIPSGSLVLMDELGRMEKHASRFRSAVLSVLASPCHAIGVIKDEDIPFMREIRAVPGVSAVEFRSDARDEGCALVLDWLKAAISEE